MSTQVSSAHLEHRAPTLSQCAALDTSGRLLTHWAAGQAVAAQAGAARLVVELGRPGWLMSVVKAGVAPRVHTPVWGSAGECVNSVRV